MPAALLCVLCLAAPLAARSEPAEPGVGLTAAVTPAELTIGAAATLSGRLAAGQGGVPLALQIRPYPLHVFTTVARTTAAADGSFSFADLRPERNTRMRVIAESQPAITGPELIVIVDPRVTMSAHSLGRGRTLLSVRIRHALLGGATSVSASWFVQARGSSVFRLAAVTPTRELSPGTLYASATIDPPSRRFAYRVCVNPPWEHAMGQRAGHGGCPIHDFLLPAGHAN